MHRRLVVLAAFIVVSLFTGFVASPKVVYAAASCVSGSGVVLSPPGFVDISYPAVKVGDTVKVTITWSGPSLLLNMINGAVGGVGGTGTSPLTGTVTIVAGPSDFFQVVTFSGSSQAFQYTIDVNGGCAGSSEGDDVTFWDFDDGRINSHDGAETAAVYCENDGGVTIYSVVNSVGKLAFKVSADEMDELPDHPEHNTLIKSGSGISLYELSTGELQINAPDNYVFIWDGCSA